MRNSDPERCPALALSLEVVSQPIFCFLGVTVHDRIPVSELHNYCFFGTGTEESKGLTETDFNPDKTTTYQNNGAYINDVEKATLLPIVFTELISSLLAFSWIIT